ncbi:MAG TPA: GGDEF domain-containing protein [Candidatus Cybelea sp.]|nr:GGDEF domain-containing protein [Candidatus Cybelea sp.]
MSASAAAQRNADHKALKEAWRLGCTGRSDEALSAALGVWERACAARDIRLEAFASIDIAWYCFQIGRAEQGLQHARKAAQIAAGLCELVWEAKARALHGWLLSELGCTEDAVEEAIRALGLAEKGGDPVALCLATNVVGIIFWITRQPDRAVEFCDRAVAMARRIGDPVVLSWWLINLGGAWAETAYAARDRGDPSMFDSAVRAATAVTEEARHLAETVGDPWSLRLCLGNLAEYASATGDFAASKRHLDAYASVVGGDYLRGQEHYLYTLGETLIHLGELDEAIGHLCRSMEIAEETGNVDTVVHAAEHLAAALERKGDFKAALEAYRRYHRAYVKLSAENAQRRARFAEIRYETDKLRSLADSESRRAREMAESYEALKQKSEHLAEAAYKDPLTGLFNRRRFEEVLREVEASGAAYVIAMVDLDHFKEINDGFSHVTGDQVLREVGALILSAVRGEDLAVRFGGEEFALLLKGASAGGGHDVCNRLRESIATWHWDGVAQGLKVTASIGLAASTERVKSEDLLTLADLRLYAAKQGGRNLMFSTGQEERLAAGITACHQR